MGSDPDEEMEPLGQIVVYDALAAAMQVEKLVCGWHLKAEEAPGGAGSGSAFVWDIKPVEIGASVEPRTVEEPLSAAEAEDLESARKSDPLPAGHQQIASGAKAHTPKGKAKAKARAQAKGQQKAKAKGQKKAQAARSSPRPQGEGQGASSSARKLAYSQAYHKAKGEAVAAGLSEQEAKDQGRIAGRAASQGL